MNEWTPRKICNWAVVAAVLLISSAGFAETTASLKLIKLDSQSQYVPRRDDAAFLFRMTYNQGIMTDERQPVRHPGMAIFPTLVKKEPAKYECKQPYKGTIKFGAETYLIVGDSTNLELNGYDLLYFDRNHNGDLTDDGVIKAMPVPENISFGSGSTNREFPRQDITLSIDGKPVEYAFTATIYTYTNEGPDGKPQIHANGSIRSAAYREGEIELNGKKARIVLLDFNSNGRFDDEFALQEFPHGMMLPKAQQLYPQNGDMLLINPNLKDRESRGYTAIDRKERQPVSKLVGIDGQYYDLKISVNGDTLTLSPSNAPLGYLTNSNDRYVALIAGEKGFIKISGGKGAKVAVPEGEWRLVSYTIDASDPKAEFSDNQSRIAAKPYTLVAAAGTTDTKAVKVTAGNTVEFPFGPPYKPLVDGYSMDEGIPNRTEAAKQYQLQMKLIGVAGESCTNLMVNGNRPEAPTFAIATTGGEIIERGKFEFG